MQGVKQPASVPLGDDYLLCPASSFAHPPAYVTVMKGPRQLFLRCPIAACGSMWFLTGSFFRDKLARDGQIGLTRKEIAEVAPNAFIF